MTRSSHTLFALLLVAGIVTAAAVQSETTVIVTKPITLNGATEVPSNGSTATGSGTITVNMYTNTVSWDITQNVSGATLSHIHGPAQAGVNANIIRPLHTSGVPAHMVGSFVIGRTPVDTLRWIINDSTYVNIHSSTFPGGEIRGQILMRPLGLPSLTQWGIILLSLLLGSAGAVYMLRRRTA